MQPAVAAVVDPGGRDTDGVGEGLVGTIVVGLVVVVLAGVRGYRRGDMTEIVLPAISSNKSFSGSVVVLIEVM